jgi:DNA invertase Pin-like site-specific DNA recombinase
MRDALKKGRMNYGVRRWSRGSERYNAVLDEDKASQIKTLGETGNFTQRELAARFGINQASVWRIIHHQSWKHVVPQ